MTLETLIKENHLTEVAYLLKGLDHCHHVVTYWHEGKHDTGEVTLYLHQADKRK